MIVNVLRSEPLRPIRSGIRRMRDYFAYCPLPWFKSREVKRGPFSSSAVAEALWNDGICILENFLSEENARVYREALDSMVAELPSEGDTPNAFNHIIDFTRHRIFADLILDELLLASIEAYYSRPVCVCCSRVQRLYPIEPYQDRAFRWHHDSKGKYVKTMWLLSDVPIHGQRMSYIVGSHKVKHPWTTYEETRFTESQARSYGRVLECAAGAGSVVVFDTNGIHRGNRNLGPTRDVLFGIYIGWPL